MTKQIVESDFLIIGSGLAGLTSAIYASEFGTVTLVSKSKLSISSTYWAQGGIAAAIDKSDSAEIHFKDTLVAGGELCNNDAVKILVNEGIDRVNDLINWGMEFDELDGKLQLGLEGGHTNRRILHAGGDATGSKVVQFLASIVQKKSNIKIYQNTQVLELLNNDEQCIGANAFSWDSNKQFIFISPVTILATGGGSGIFSRTTNPYTSTGDGITLAYNAGAEICDMEFLQFHPTAFYSENDQTFLISEAVRGEGAYLLNGDGKRFMLDIHPNAELAPRDIVSKAIFYELQNSKIKSVFLDLTHLNAEKIKERFSSIYEKALEYNIDITKNLIPVSPAAHYMIGGVKTDINGRTNIKGLLACGEVTCTGVHGANRLASNSLLECLVFGKRCIDISGSIKNSKILNIQTVLDQTIDYKINNFIVDKFMSIKNKIATLLNNNAGIIRNEELLTSGLKNLEMFKQFGSNKEFEYYSFRIKSIIEIGELIIKSALNRKESRGTHQRSDFAETNNLFLGRYIFQNGHRIKFEKHN